MTDPAPPQSLVRPELGPSLPELLRQRFGLSRRAATALVAGVLAVIAVAVLVAVTRDDGIDELRHERDPQFTMLYARAKVRPVAPHPGEIVRLEARRGIDASVTVRPLHLPPYSAGKVSYGLLPSYAEGYKDRIDARFGRFLLRDEGRANVNGFPGYQLGYRTGPPGHRTYWRDILVLPDQPHARDGVILRFRQTQKRRRRLTRREHGAVAVVKKAFRSFRFGLDRP